MMGHRFSRCVPGKFGYLLLPIPGTGCRVSPRVELAVLGKRPPEVFGRVQCPWLTFVSFLPGDGAIPRMCSRVEDERCGHVNQEKVIPRMYSTGRGPALIHSRNRLSGFSRC